MSTKFTIGHNYKLRPSYRIKLEKMFKLINMAKDYDTHLSKEGCPGWNDDMINSFINCPTQKCIKVDEYKSNKSWYDVKFKDNSGKEIEFIFSPKYFISKEQQEKEDFDNKIRNNPEYTFKDFEEVEF